MPIMTSADELLHNGIRLPSPWPPKERVLTLEPATPPYLVSPPKVIPIDVGRQLFVDDFLVEETTLRRTFHTPEYYAGNPVLNADKPWEDTGTGRRRGPMAMPFSDGVWYDPKDGLFKMWYMGDYRYRYLCYATSRDGIHWDKPSLDVRPGTNIVHPKAGGARVVWLDLEEKDPGRRFKLITTRGGADLIKPDQKWWGSRCSMTVSFSPDGIHWTDADVRYGPCGDRNSAFYNAFRKVWVFSIRAYLPFGGSKGPMRCRRYWETHDLVNGPKWKYNEPPLWVGADRLDIRLPDHGNLQPQLYNLDAVAYESVLLGLFTIWRGGSNRPEGRPKPNEVCIAFSRDGLHWHRPSRRAFMPISERKGDWNWGNVSSAGGCCLVVRDKLYFYVSGRAGGPRYHDAAGSTGLAVLRRDGFCSMDAGDKQGTLTTRALRFGGRYCFVNADAKRGQLRAEILDERGQVIPAFSRDKCTPVRGDSTLQSVRWNGRDDLAALAGKPVKFRFYLTNASLYAFWVSPGRSGASHGYVAAGGPGFTGSTDTVGAGPRGN